jgi:hypothetical protein
MKLNRLIFFLGIVTLASCEKQDEPYVLPPPGNVEQAQVQMGDNYEMEIFFRFEDKLTVSAPMNAWDLEFETAPEAFMLRMNGGKQVQVFNTGSTDFGQHYSTSGVSWQWDSPDGNPDSAAFRNWFNTTTMTSKLFVYLIDRGPDATSDRYKKMQLVSVDQQQYVFKYANPDGSASGTFTIVKDTNFNYIYFTFNDGGKLVHPEPGKNKYDILFTRYRYIYYDLIPQLPYSVNGVLINPFNTAVAADSVTSFDSIDYSFAKNMHYNTAYDAVGFDWKTYNFSTSYYEVNPEKCYVLKNQDGIYYKFRFIDFYDANGIKGSPEFEFQRL